MKELASSWRSTVISPRGQLILVKWLKKKVAQLVQMRSILSDACTRCGGGRGTHDLGLPSSTALLG